MKKTIFLLTLLLILPIVSAGVSRDDILIGAVRFGDYGHVTKPEMDSYVYVHNNARCCDMEDTSISIRVLDSDVFDSETGIRIKDGEGYGKFFMTPIDELPEGEYLVRVTVSSGGVRRVKHRYIFVS